MMGEPVGRQDRLFYEFDLEDMVPGDHLLRRIQSPEIDFRLPIPPFALFIFESNWPALCSARSRISQARRSASSLSFAAPIIEELRAI